MSAEPTLIDNKNRSKDEDASVAVAELSRETDWKSKSFVASLYLGELDDQLCFPFPEQPAEDKAAADDLIARLDAWCAENIDGEEIDRSETIPAHVLRGMQEFNLFAIKIPKEYGGLGMSQTNYMRILSTVAKHCGSTAATLSAHQSIGVPQPLKLFGTPEQKKKYLPKFAEGWVSAFALTEPSVGSDPANMETVATLSEDGTHWILNGYKLWCTNGVIADVAVVMAKTGSVKKGGREINSISAFIVEMRWEGVEVMHRCQFMGIRAIENGIIKFTDVKVPVENLLWGEGKGLRLALTTLNDGRLGIPAISAASLRDAADFAARWGKTRYQWGKLVGEHEAGAEKLARVAGGAYAMETMAMFCAAMSDRGDVDIRMEAAAAKLYTTEMAWYLADTALQFRGGRGFETAASLKARGEIAVPIERGLRDARINRIVEGTSDIMHLFLAREALDPLMRMAGPLLSKRTSIQQKLAAAGKTLSWGLTWLPTTLFGGFVKDYPGFRGRWGEQMSWVDKKVRRLALTLLWNMVKLGPKLEMRQNTLARIVDLGAELGVMALVASRAQTAENRGDSSESETAWFYLQWGRQRVEQLFHELRHNTDADARKLAKALMAKAEVLPEPAPMSELKPLAKREFGSDLTTGKQKKRLAHGGTPPKA